MQQQVFLIETTQCAFDWSRFALSHRIIRLHHMRGKLRIYPSFIVWKWKKVALSKWNIEMKHTCEPEFNELESMLWSEYLFCLLACLHCELKCVRNSDCTRWDVHSYIGNVNWYVNRNFLYEQRTILLRLEHINAISFAWTNFCKVLFFSEREEMCKKTEDCCYNIK